MSRALALAALLGAGCRKETGPSEDDFAAKTSLIRLERTACYGACPVYTIELHANGLVEFDGRNFTGTCGRATGTIAPDAFARLARRFHAAEFFRLRDDNDRPGGGPCGADCGGAITAIRVGDKGKTVRDTYCCTTPPALDALDTAIDEAAASARWVGGCNQVPPGPSAKPNPCGCPGGSFAR